MKKDILPYATAMLSSDLLLNIRRQLFEFGRKLRAETPRLEIYISAVDPYSYLLIQLLPELIERYSLDYRIHTLQELQSEMFPDAQKWQSNSLIDVRRLAKLYSLKAPGDKVNLRTERVNRFCAELVTAEASAGALKKITLILERFWNDLSAAEEVSHAHSPESVTLLKNNQERLKSKGHYLPGMLHYGGEWYWGIDRLDHLEKRLNALFKKGQSAEVKYDLQSRYFCRSDRPSGPTETALEIFYSARSPYSYIGLEQAKRLTDHYGIELQIKPVLPMMMRGMNVPNTKKMYIFHDTKREAKKKGISYGRVADPLGEAVENCYGLYTYAVSQGKALDFLLAFGQAVNSEGIRADREKGLALICHRAGLNWELAKPFVKDEQWRPLVKQNIEELAELGLWGVPCFRFGQTVVWGQDRLWVIEQQVIAGQSRS